MLLANNDVVSATDADNFGVFRFRGISPGQYALVAVGADGMGCIGISVVNESSSGILPEPVVPADPSVDATGADSAARQPAVAKRLAVDFSLMPPEATGWLNHMATEEAYRRALTRQRPKSNDLQPDMFAPICYSTPNGCFRQFFKQLNAASDMIFFGESSQYGYGNGYGNGYGGYGDYGYGYGNECGGCGGAGCQICQPGMMTDPNGMPYQVAPPVPDMMPIPQNGPVTIPGQMIYDQ
jgi:hypothetical protein